MDSDPNDAPRYLEGVEYPANEDGLASAAEESDAPGWLVERILTLGRPRFSGPEEVVAELEAHPTSW